MKVMRHRKQGNKVEDMKEVFFFKYQCHPV